MGAVGRKLFTRLAGIDLFKLADTVDRILFSQVFSLKLIFFFSEGFLIQVYSPG